MVEAEKTLRQTVIADLRRLKALGVLTAIWIPMSSGAYFPRKERPGTYGAQVEDRIIRTICDRLKTDGELYAGVADFLFLWSSGSGAIELKRERQPELFRKLPPGRPSNRQVEFAGECERSGVRYALCHNVFEVRNALVAWGRLTLEPVDRALGRANSQR